MEEFLSIHPGLLVHSQSQDGATRAAIPETGGPCTWTQVVFRITISKSTNDVLEICNTWKQDTSAKEKNAYLFSDERCVDVDTYFLFTLDPIDRTHLALAPNPASIPPVEPLRTPLDTAEPSEEDPYYDQQGTKDKPSEALSISHLFSHSHLILSARRALMAKRDTAGTYADQRKKWQRPSQSASDSRSPQTT